ncbi:MAG: CheR family methyltransferase [Minicystis sp.]
MVFSRHNLASEESLNEFQLVLCRNVLIYFDAELQLRVHRLLHARAWPTSACSAWGRRISLPAAVAPAYDRFDHDHRIYRRKPGVEPPAGSTR